MSDEALEELKKCFLEAYDDNNDGKIDIREVGDNLSSNGQVVKEYIYIIAKVHFTLNLIKSLMSLTCSMYISLVLKSAIFENGNYHYLANLAIWLFGYLATRDKYARVGYP